MRTVVKKVIRSVSASASAASSVMSRESQLRVDFNQSRLKVDFMQSEIINSIPIQNKSLDSSKHNSLSPSYKLSHTEETSFEELLDKECDYYPDNSCRGDMVILNKMDDNTIILEKNVTSTNVMMALKNIRFINSIMINETPVVFLIAANYIQRLLHKKAVKKDLMSFIAAAVYDFALEHRINKALTNDQISSLFSVSNIPINHIEDFSRIKQLLLKQLNNDLQFIIITDYLQVLLKIDLNESSNLPDSHIQLIEIACVLATSCELTHFTLACQAISLVNLAARHVSLDKSFLNEFSDVIKKFPLIFLSPVRLNQFANVANVDEYGIQSCTQSIIRYYAKYYKSSNIHKAVKRKNQCLKKDSFDKPHLKAVMEEPLIINQQSQQNLNISELIEKLSKVSLMINSHIGGKQKKRHKRIKKSLSRQLKKYGKDVMGIKKYGYDFVDEDDSAISSSSNVTSPSNSPLTF